MKEKLTRNIGVKILSILLAAFLWVVITNIDDPIKSIKLRKIVEILNEDEILTPNQGYEIVSGKYAEFVVSARKSIIDNISENDFKVTADFALLSGVNATEIKIEPIRYKGDVIIAESSKNQMMKINIQEMMTKNFKVKLEAVGDVPDGYAIGVLTASPNIISVSGPKSRVESIDQIIATANVLDATGPMTTIATPKALDKEGNEIDGSVFNYSVNYVTVNLELYKTKMIDVIILTKGNVNSNYTVTGIEYEPKEIEVKGKNSNLIRTKEVVIEVDISDLTESLEKDINIKDYLPEGINLVDEDEVAGVKVSVERLETRDVTIQPIDIDVKYMTSNLDFKMNSIGPVTVKVTGAESYMDDVSVKTLRPYIDLSEYKTEGTYPANIKFDPLEGFEVINKPVISISLLP